MTIVSFFIEEWRDFAKKHDGSIRNTKTGASPVGFGLSSWKKVYLTIPYKNSEIVFVTGEATRMEIYYKFKKDLHQNFLIYPEDSVDKIALLFNIMSEITINDEEFDKCFFIKSNNENLVNNILTKDIKTFLIENRRYISNYKLEKTKEISILELNSPFNENNLVHMEQVLSFMKNSVDGILRYNKN